ncbi:hypothetical protein Taro_036315 [Colocasia esculenta]|uniref:Uncharacterized protein n=1 Tax=Colocasia esculenta TaxID=4460 RepID=A0A843W2S4_COLES|nr:hypothetical protein [Colocasia esculenta]
MARLACRLVPQGRVALRTFCVPICRVVPCVPVLADGPSGGCSWKGCRVCLWPLGLFGLRASGVVSIGVCHTSSLSPGTRHLRACLRDRLLPFPETPSPACLCQRVLLRAAGVLKSQTWSRRGKWWGNDALNCCFGNPFLGAVRGAPLFLPDLVEVQDVGACVVRLWSLVVAPVFRRGVALSSFASALLEFLLLWLVRDCLANMSSTDGKSTYCGYMIFLKTPCTLRKLRWNIKLWKPICPKLGSTFRSGSGTLPIA